jgi:hypothetical protein
MSTVTLHRLAHARAGDKGNRLNLALVAHRAEDWPLLAREVTEARVLALFAHRGATAVRRMTCPACKPSISSSRTCCKAASTAR